MERDRKEKAQVPAKVWALAVRGKEKAAAKAAAGDKVVDRAKDRAKERAKVAGRAKDGAKVTHRIGEFLSEKEN